MKKHYSLYLWAFFTATMAAASIYVVADIVVHPVKILTRDPYKAARVPAFFAYFSLLGSTIWLIAGAATLTTGIVVRKVLGCRLSDLSTYRLIILGGIVGLIMAVDDILLFHDAFAGHVGIPEILFHIFYFVFIALMIVYSRKVLFLTPWMLFFASLTCFGLSSGIDLLVTSQGRLNESEDVFKFCAIILWGFYFLGVSWDFVKEHSSLVQLRKDTVAHA